MEKNAADVLEDAADWLLVHGRCRSTLVEEDGSGCLMYVIHNVPPTGSHRAATGAWGALDAYTREHFRVGPVTWNFYEEDDGSVRDVLLLVAKDLRAEAAPT